jgi:hypothetical protein
MKPLHTRGGNGSFPPLCFVAELPHVSRNGSFSRRRKVYNNGVESPILPKPPADKSHRHRNSIYAAESTGLIILAVLLLIFTVIRYWRNIPWGAR